ncbi:hypothetical protein GCM10009676_22200 [Prauserella halophila]|uniref:Uncharacterized protein n=1 Tax=Prauserella halophila TaxID=185641 RepID=A0ABN1W8F9_9PSEU|nr:hypothetical protein [Prauserella halophila]MCP2235587.1 hypothetical protein [Prauserella halophila]
MIDDDKIHKDGRGRKKGRNEAAANRAEANGAAANGAEANGAEANGAEATGAASNGAASNGAVTTGTASNGAASTSAAAQARGEEGKSGLRAAPVIAGGVAATTAAFLCSFFGVYGTVIGTGAISVLSTVGSELYLRSLRRSREAARRAKARAAALTESKGGGRSKGRTAVLDVPAESRQSTATQQPTAVYRRPTAVPGAVPHGSAADPTTRRILSNADQPTDYLGVPDRAGTAEGGEAGSASDPATGRGLLRRRWLVLAATSAVVFGIGLLVLTGFELVKGESLNGQGRSTVGAIIGDRGPSDSGDGAGDGRDGDTPATTEGRAPAETVDPSGGATPGEDVPQPSEEQGGGLPTGEQSVEPSEPAGEPEPTEADEPTTAPPEQPAEPEAGDAAPAP